MASSPRRTPLDVAVLALLSVGPLHPYGVQALIKHWGKDDVVNVGQRATLYRAFNRLADASLLAVRQTERDQQYPERTVYELTASGRRTLRDWLAEMLSTPRNEFPEFPAALSFLMVLAPDEARPLLDRRRELLAAKVSELEASLATELAPGPDRVPAVAMLETEYLLAVTSAELAWVRKVVDDLDAGRLSWNDAELRSFATTHPPTEDAPAPTD